LNAPAEKINNQIFNVGDNRLNYSLAELGEKVKKVALKFDIDLEVNIIQAEAQDTRNYVVSFKKIKDILGFEASIMLEDGLFEIIEKFKLGIYYDYKNNFYSNLLVTKNLKDDFYNLNTRKTLYAPISENSLA
jgi:negative regulator of genetic competence, sporulation and motility